MKHSIIFNRIVAMLAVASTVSIFSWQATSAPLPGLAVPAKMTVGDSVNTFAIADANYLNGGHMQVANRSALLAVTRERRSNGMMVTVIDDDAGTGGNQTVTYRLIDNPTADGSSGTPTNTDISDWTTIIPSMNGNNGKFLTTDGTGMSWADIDAGGGTIIGGSNTGAGAEVYKGLAGSLMQFRTFVAGAGLSVTQGADDITVENTGVLSFNTRTGAITLTDTDVSGALGYTPYDATNPANYISTISSFTTDDLAEGSLNLYYTAARFNAAFGGKSTSDLTEGTNLYFTDARARAAVSGTAPLSYNSTTGVFGITQSDTSTDGYLSSTDWNTFNNKQSALTIGNLTVGSNLSVSGGTGAVIGSGAVVSLGSNVVTAVTNDTNITGSIAANNITLGWTGQLAISRGGTGATTLNDLITLGTHTTGNYLATLSGNSQISVTGSGSEGATPSLAIVADSIGDTQLAFNTGQDLTTVSSPTFAGITIGSLSGILKASAGVVSGSATTSDLPEGSNLYFTNARGIASTLTGYTSGAGTISSADSILSAIQKLNGNIVSLPRVTSVSGSGGTTGLTLTGGPITSTGTLTLGGTLGVPNGGTGNTSFTTGNILFGNGTSALATSDNLFWNNASNSLTIKSVASGGIVDAGSTYTSIAFGRALNSSQVKTGSSADTSLAFGFADNESNIQNLGAASLAFGYADGTSNLTSIGQGSITFGKLDIFSTIYSTGNGAFTGGDTSATGTIQTTAAGAMAFGSASGTSTITSNDPGAIALGYADNLSTIQSSSAGSFAFGYASEGTIQAGGAGAVVFGSAYNASTISANGTASYIFGQAIASGSSIQALSQNSYIFGDTTFGNLLNEGESSFLFGSGISNNTNYTFKVGWGSVALDVGNAVTYLNSTNINIPTLTASKVIFTDGSQNLTSTGTVGIDQGGTGATTLNDLITLGTHTTGNYLATLTGNSQISVTGSGSEGATPSLAIVADSIGDTQLAFNTGQNLTTVSSPTFAGLTVGGNSVLTTSNVSGTTNYIPKFTGTNTIGDSIIIDNGTGISVSGGIDANGNIRGSNGGSGQALIGNSGYFTGDEAGLYETSNGYAIAVFDYDANLFKYANGAISSDATSVFGAYDGGLGYYGWAIEGAGDARFQSLRSGSTALGISGVLMLIDGVTGYGSRIVVNDNSITNDRDLYIPDETGTIATREWTGAQGFITANQTITLSGDITGSGTTAITTTIAANAVALATDTTGNYIATITGGSQVGVSGSGSENAGVTLSINNDSIGDTQLAFNTGQHLTTSSNVTFANITATSFIKSGGTSSQFLKADGSVDTTTYATASSLGSYLPLSGGYVNGGAYFYSNKGSGTYLGSTDTPSLQVFSDDLGTAFMSFHRGGAYAVNMGLDSDNVFRIGGWSAPANLLQLDMSGNLTTQTVNADYLNSNYGDPTTMLTLTRRSDDNGSNTDNSGASVLFRSADVDGNIIDVVRLDGTIQDPNYDSVGRYGDFAINLMQPDISGFVERFRIKGDTGNATFTDSVTASSFIKAGGASTEFLKADGSVDTSTYLTSSGLTNYVTTNTTQAITGAKTFSATALRVLGYDNINAGTLKYAEGASAAVITFPDAASGQEVAYRNWVISQAYLTSSSLTDYVTTNTTQAITANKTFENDATAIFINSNADTYQFSFPAAGSNSFNINFGGTLDGLGNPFGTTTVAYQEWVTALDYLPASTAASTYVPLSGGTLTGLVNWKGGVGLKADDGDVGIYNSSNTLYLGRYSSGAGITVTSTGNVGVTGTLTVTNPVIATGINLGNAQWYAGKTTGGVDAALLGVASDNNIYMGDVFGAIPAASLVLRTNGANRLTITAAGAATFSGNLTAANGTFSGGTVEANNVQSNNGYFDSIAGYGNSFVNVTMEMVVSGSTTATSFIKTGGTSSQFLKADGSVDSSTYVSSAYTGFDSRYLRLTGGTLTGSLNGTSASFSSGVGINTGNVLNLDQENDLFNYITHSDGTGDLPQGVVIASSNAVNIWNGEENDWNTIKAGMFVRNGGTSSQFLKADGSVDSSTYLTSSALTNYVTTNTTQTVTGDKTFTGGVTTNMIRSVTTASAVGGNFVMWKDATPTKAFAIGFNDHTGTSTDDFNLSRYNGSSWSSALTISTANAVTFGSGITNSAADSFAVGYGAYGLFVSSTNLVGIGTNTPGQALEVNGNVALTGSGWYRAGTNNWIGTTDSLRTGGGTSTDLGIRSDGNVVFMSGGGTERARFDTSGRLGIGTTAPTRTFEIAENLVNNTSGSSSQMSIRGTANTANKLNIGYNTTSNFGFIEAVNQSIAWQNLILQPTAGNVGIGVNPSSYKLEVAGTVANFVEGNLGSTTGDYKTLNRVTASGQTNTFMMNDFVVREGTGTDWQTTSYLRGISVDASFLTPSTLKSWIKQYPNAGKISFGDGATEIVQVTGNGLAINPSGSYLNFSGSLGSAGYGIRNNTGIMEFKNSSGSWAPFGTGSPAGSSGYVQFNNGGSFAADAGLFWNNTLKSLGIGTTAPVDFKLQVAGDIGPSTGDIYSIGSADLRYAEGHFVNLIAPNIYSGDDPGSVLFVNPLGAITSDTTNFFWDDTNNRLGIGNASPSAPLDVTGRITIAPSGTTPDNAYNGQLVITKPTASGQYINLIRAGTSGWSIGTVYNTSNFAIGQINGTDASFTSPFLMIDSTNGNVGIGTASAGEKLTVNGNISITNAQDTSGNIRFSAANPYISASSWIAIPGGAYFNGAGTVYFENQLQARGGIHNDNAGYLTINGGTSGYTNFTGSVGIGVNTPSTEFHIVSTTPELRLESNSGSDDIERVSFWDNALGELSYIENHTVNGTFSVATKRTLELTTLTNRAINVSTNNTLAMEISTSQDVGIGVTPSYRLDISKTAGSYAGAVVRITNANASCTFDPDQTPLPYSCTSDMRLKKDITTIEIDALPLLAQIRAVTYRWNPESENDPTHTGFIAQNIEQVFPEFVTTNDDGYKTVAFGGFMPYMIKGIQELDIKVQALPSFDEIDQGLATKIAEFLDGIARRGEAFVDKVKTKNIQTEQLCVGTDADQVCITKDQLQQLLQNSPTNSLGGGGGSTPVPPPDPTPDPSPEPDPEPDPVPTDGGDEGTPQPDVVPTDGQ